MYLYVCVFLAPRASPRVPKRLRNITCGLRNAQVEVHGVQVGVHRPKLRSQGALHKPAGRRRTSSLTLHDRLGVFWRDDMDEFSSLAAASVASSASQSPVEALAASMHATRRAYEERGEAAVRVHSPTAPTTKRKVWS